ncbi:MAG: hypothetical protein RIQ33_1267 [Bacteroidota bacterium]
MLKKIQQYFLENKPLYYQSKFFEMMGIGILLWVISYCFGWLITDIKTLQDNYNISNYYFGSFAIVHVIICIIIYVLWAFKFFQTNALKHFYPLSKFYHHKLFLQIIVPALFMISLYYPFTTGVYGKVKFILKNDELVSELKILNKAYPFLVESSAAYDVTNKTYPAPFPIASFSKNNNNEWSNNGVYFKPNHINGIFDTSNILYNPNECKQIVLVDNQEYIFYKSHDETVKFDSCNSRNYEVIDSFIQPAHQLIKYNSSVAHFSQILIQNNFDKLSNYDAETYYINDIAPNVHQIINTKNKKALVNIIDSFLNICNKYEIKHRVSSDKYADYLLAKDFKIVSALSNSSEWNNGYSPAPADVTVVDESPMVTESREKSVETNPTLGFVEFESIRRIYSNYQTAENNIYQFDVFLFCIALALIIAMVILLAFSVEGVATLISIPATGVVILLCGLLAILLHSNDSAMVWVLFIIALIFIALGYYYVTSSEFSKRYTSIMVLLGFYAIPFAATFLCIIIHEFSKYSIHQPCDNNYTAYAHKLEPLHIIMLGLVGFLLYLPLLKKLKAKAE